MKTQPLILLSEHESMESDPAIWVNPDHICWMQSVYDEDPRFQDHARVSLSSGTTLKVTQTPEQIIKLIQEYS